MTIPILSLLALFVALLLSMFTRINVGLICIAFAWLIGVYVVGLTAESVASGFPVSLFLTLTGVTLLFSLVETNGSLAGLAQGAMSLVSGRPRIIPLLLFFIAAVLSAFGPGAIAVVALLVPIGIAMGSRVGLPPLLTALMIANGANSGNLSPISIVGIIANQQMAAAGLPGHESRLLLANFLANALVAAAAYAWLVRRIPAVNATASFEPAPSTRFNGRQITTLGVLGIWIAAIVIVKVNLGLSAFLAASALILLRAADQDAALRRMPWAIIVMVCGVSVLISLLERNGGMEVFARLLGTLATPTSLNGVVAFVCGVISSYSSTSGVVLPTFLPMVPSLVAQVGGGDPLAASLSIAVGSTLVDVSPLSTLGALCVSAVADPVQSRRLFYQLLAWGLSMTVVGAVLCQLFARFVAAY